jgi:2,3-bisphosphoglycerate-independent phosphoglycerate mutase
VNWRAGIKKEEFAGQPNIVASLKHAKEHGSRLHLCGLISDGGVHSHISHVFELVKAAKAQGIEHIYIHFFGDGRDTAPRSATKYIGQLQDFLKEQGVGEIATVVGRYFAMDRDKRWDRVKIAVDGLVQGTGDKVDDEKDLIKTIEKGYEGDITDEFIKPIICGSEGSRIQSELNHFRPRYAR